MLTIFICAASFGIVGSYRWNPSLGNLPSPKECPASNFGCIYDDLPHAGHTDCTRGGTPICQAVGADYCSAFIGYPPRRTCCVITGVKQIKPNPDSRGCPESNKGCIFDDFASNTPCSKGGNDLCKEAGLDYCGSAFNYPRRMRVCCKIAQNPSPMPVETTENVQCPQSNMGCIFDSTPGDIDCTDSGNVNCSLGGEDYCGALINDRRMCCKITDKKSRGRPIPSAKACPAGNRGCIFTDESTNSECTKNGDPDCKAAETDYCGAFYGFPPKRSCCNIGKTPIEVPIEVPVPVPAEVPVPVAVPANSLPPPAPSGLPQYPGPLPFNPSFLPQGNFGPYPAQFPAGAGFGANPTEGGDPTQMDIENPEIDIQPSASQYSASGRQFLASEQYPATTEFQEQEQAIQYSATNQYPSASQFRASLYPSTSQFEQSLPYPATQFSPSQQFPATSAQFLPKNQYTGSAQFQVQPNMQYSGNADQFYGVDQTLGSPWFKKRLV